MRVRIRVLVLLLITAPLLAVFLGFGTNTAEAQGSFDQELIRLTNAHRASIGRPALTTSSSISAGAKSWSNTMLSTGNFRHASDLGRLAENIAYSGGTPGRAFPVTWNLSAGPLPSYCRSSMDYTTAEFIMCSWLSSSGHRRAIESSSYRQVGSGTSTGPSQYGRTTYSTMRFSADAPSSPAPAPAPAPPSSPPRVIEPGHSVDANTSGDVAMVALKADGKLWARRNLGNGWSGWQSLGNGGWASADVTIAPSGRVHVAAITGDGRLYTQKWTAGGSWSGWVNHGSGWDPTTTPSISSNSTSTFLGAITSQGRLLTKGYQSSSWTGATAHGVAGWAHVDVDIAADGDLWFAAVKDSGKLYLRKHLGSSWSAFSSMGMATWSNDTPPAIAARSNGVVFGAVKNDGRLYTREQRNGVWSRFVRHGVNSWTSIDISMNEQGTKWLAAHKAWGRLYTRNQTSAGSWGRWSIHGADTWSVHADASISIGAGGQPVLVAVKSNNILYYRPRTGNGWAGWSKLGAGNWATGR